MDHARIVWLLCAVLALSGCAAKRPVLYPNTYYHSVGAEKARQDIDECLKLADNAGTDDNRAAELAKKTGKSAVIGGATGAVIGAITGSLGRGSLIGAATGGTMALVGGLFSASEPTPV